MLDVRQSGSLNSDNVLILMQFTATYLLRQVTKMAKGDGSLALLHSSWTRGSVMRMSSKNWKCNLSFKAYRGHGSKIHYRKIRHLSFHLLSFSRVFRDEDFQGFRSSLSFGNPLGTAQACSILDGIYHNCSTAGYEIALKDIDTNQDDPC